MPTYTESTAAGRVRLPKPADTPAGQTRKPRRFSTSALLLTALLLPGCAGGLEFAAVGAAASAAQAGATVVKAGKINAAHLTDFDAVLAAAEAAAADAGLTVKRRNTDAEQGRARLDAYDADGAKYEFEIDRRSDRLVRYRIDVGWFGHDATARLLLRRMQVHLALSQPDDLETVPLDELKGATE